MNGTVVEGSKVRLTNGLVAWVVEVFDQSNFLAEVLSARGTIDETKDITINDIKSVFVEHEEPMSIH
jgi:Flp pilus assembly CpaF family ATPase